MFTQKGVRVLKAKNKCRTIPISSPLLYLLRHTPTTIGMWDACESNHPYLRWL